MRPGRIFLNRWTTLAFAAGVVWMAIVFADPGETAREGSNQVTTDITGAPVTNEQVNEIASIINDI